MTCALTTSRGAENPHTGHSCQHSASVLGTAAPHAHLTGFRRIFLHQLSPGACSLVPEFGKERVPSGVVDRAGQYSARKSFLCSSRPPRSTVAFHQPTAEIMM